MQLVFVAPLCEDATGQERVTHCGFGLVRSKIDLQSTNKLMSPFMPEGPPDGRVLVRGGHRAP